MKNRLTIALFCAALVMCACTDVERKLYRSDASPIVSGDTLVFTLEVPSLAKGSQVDFMASVAAPDSAASAYWAVEFWDGAKWQRDPELVHVLPKKVNHNAVVMKSFRIAKALKREAPVQVRMVPAAEGKGALVPAGDRHVDQRIVAYQGYPQDYKHSVGCIGNSFTYYYGAAFMLKEIARCEGVQLDMHASLKGGQYFRQHINLPLTQEMMEADEYDVVFLQDQSQQSARYYEGQESVLVETKALGDAIRQHSPDAQLVLEATWAYEGSANWQGYGSFEAFDEAMQKGGEAIADQLGYICSPLGRGFELARKEGIDLYWEDGKHQNANGSYLKACINYLLMFCPNSVGFRSSRFTDCGIGESVAAQLREIALEVVAEAVKGNYDNMPDSE